jgi:hypothetical protein
MVYQCFCYLCERNQVNTIFTFKILKFFFPSSNGGGKGNTGHQALVQWSEVPGHTGLLYCMTQATNNPVVLMIKPDTLMIQEIKVVPAKAKIQDVVAIRHNASNSDQVCFMRIIGSIILIICQCLLSYKNYKVS